MLWIASTSPRRTCVNADNKILVIGGGMSGLTAALEAAEAGSQVI
ncbi:MAG: FAD-binding protein, partial [Desulfobaccales bacterium]